eukprot:scaffold14896_cov111-Isochrysis_galbana.AAC.11
MEPMPDLSTQLTIQEGASLGVGWVQEYEKRTEVGESGSTMMSMMALILPSLNNLPAALGLGGSSMCRPVSGSTSCWGQCRTHNKKLPSRRLSQPKPCRHSWAGAPHEGALGDEREPAGVQVALPEDHQRVGTLDAVKDGLHLWGVGVGVGGNTGRSVRGGIPGG